MAFSYGTGINSTKSYLTEQQIQGVQAVSKTKDRWLVFLLCLNAVLITALIAQCVGLPQAQAQVRAYDYMLIPGNLDLEKQVVWVIDLGSHRMTSCMYNNSRQTIDFGPVVNLN